MVYWFVACGCITRLVACAISVGCTEHNIKRHFADTDQPAQLFWQANNYLLSVCYFSYFVLDSTHGPVQLQCLLLSAYSAQTQMHVSFNCTRRL